MTCGDDKTYEVLISPTILDVSFKVEEIVSDPAVAKIEPESRKCLYANEPQPGSHYDVRNIFKKINWLMKLLFSTLFHMSDEEKKII